MNITNQQIQIIHALLPVAIKQDKFSKEQMISQYTGNRNKCSTKDLTHTQANQMITALGGKPVGYDHWAVFDKNNSQHKYILSLCIQLGWKEYAVEYNRYIANTHTLSEWLKGNRSPVKKPLKKMSVKECSKVIGALESMLNKSL